jgi:methylthioribose-1-phosphate isomerase
MSMAPADSPEVISYRDGQLVVLDQTWLPRETRLVSLNDLDAVEGAIRNLVVRGAPLIGVAAAYGLCVSLNSCRTREEALARAPEALRRLRASRPTAVNLFWALARMETVLRNMPGQDWREALEREARAIHEEGIRQDEALIAHGLTLLGAGAHVVTHCNTGPLATGGWGTALGVLIAAHRALGSLHVYVDETRPRWQGAHLTTWELAQAGVPHTLIADGAAAFLMRRNRIHSAWVGADRIAANGDTANKIGTYALALAAAHHGVPFYVAAPSSTVDLALHEGSAIPIEERAPEEVTAPEGRALAPAGTTAWNPAFDVTPAVLISAIITERGVLRGPRFDLRRDLAELAREAAPVR